MMKYAIGQKSSAPAPSTPQDLQKQLKLEQAQKMLEQRMIEADILMQLQLQQGAMFPGISDMKKQLQTIQLIQLLSAQGAPK